VQKILLQDRLCATMGHEVDSQPGLVFVSRAAPLRLTRRDGYVLGHGDFHNNSRPSWQMITTGFPLM
jgi:hypothetical protein